MEKKLSCPLCKQDYCETRIPRLIPTCGHTMCEGCIEECIDSSDQREIYVVCPQDGKVTALEDHDVRNFPKNFAILKMIARLRAEKEKEQERLKQKQNIKEEAKISAKDVSVTLKENVNRIERQQSQIQSDQPKEESPKKSESSENQSKRQKLLDLQKVCLIHDKPLEIICTIDRTKICSNCAIFGQHRGHDFKTVQQFQKDKLNQCDNILQILEGKEKAESRLTTQFSKEQLALQLKQRKEIQVTQIKESYTKLSQCLLLSQKKALNKLYQLFGEIEQKIQSLRHCEDLFCRYYEWEKEACENIEIFESNDLRKQIEILNYTNKQSDIIELGNRILNTIVKESEWVLERKNELMNSCVVEYCKGLDLGIVNYCTISLKKEENTLRESRQLERRISACIPLEESYTTKSHIQQSELKPHPSHISKMDPREAETNEDYLLQEFRIQQASKFNPPVSSIYQKSFQRISSIQNLSRERSRQLSMNESIHTSFVRNIVISGIRSPPTGSRRVSKQATCRIRKLRLPEKYQKIYQGICADTLDLVDLTGAQLGDQIVLEMMSCLQNNKCKTVKLIRNKISDQCLSKMWRYFQNVITLNLSQNLLTQRSIDSLIQNLPRLPNLKSVILSQNRIKQRAVKLRIEEIKKQGITVSL